MVSGWIDSDGHCANLMNPSFSELGVGYYNAPGDAAKLLVYSLGEQLGMRQRTVWWRVRAMFWNPRKKTWGDMQRTGVGNLATEKSTN